MHEHEMVEPRAKRLMEKTKLLVTVNSMVSAILGTMALVFIAKYMGSYALGILGFAMSFVGIFNAASDLGFSSAHVKHLNDGKDVRRCVGTFASIKFVLTGAMALVFLCTVFLFNLNVFGEISSPYKERIMLVFLAYYALANLNAVTTVTYNNRKMLAKSQLPAIAEQAVRFAIIVFVATSVVRTEPVGVSYLALAYAVGVGFSLIPILLLFKDYKPGLFDRELMKSYYDFAKPFFFVSIVGVLALNVDKVIIGFFFGANEVGYYFGVQRLCVFVSAFAVSVSAMILPSIYIYHKQEDIESQKDLLLLTERYIALIIFPIALFYLGFGTELTRLFLSDEFVVAVDILTLLVLATLFTSLSLTSESLILGRDGMRKVALVRGVFLAISIVLMLVLVPASLWGLPTFGFGGLGAAIAVLVSSAGIFLTFRAMAWKMIGPQVNIKMGLYILCALAMVIVVKLASSQFIQEIRWFYLIVIILAGLGMYVGLVYAVGAFKKSDYYRFRNLMNPEGLTEEITAKLWGK